jgi:DNA-binding LacI/PurR family transcriptional regulator
MQIRRGVLAPGHRLHSERDLAAEFGVSQMTANRALLELVRDGWLERRVGSGTFVSKREENAPGIRERTIVLLAAFTDHPEEDVYLQAPFRGISKFAAQEGCTLLVAHSPESGFLPLVDRYPHATFILVAPSEAAYPTLCEMHAQHIPFVVLGASWPDAPFACVDSDNVGGARSAVEYLLRLGHRRIAYINGTENSANCRDRLSGYRTALRDCGLPDGPDCILSAGSDWELNEASRHEVTEMLIGREAPTAFFCAGFYLTLSLLELLRTMQMQVPQDVSIISFDDLSMAAHLSPPLTTIRQPLYTMGERACERALTLLTEPATSEGGVELMPTNLILRGSCKRVC